MKKEKGRLPSGKIMKYRRCIGCPAKYKGIIKGAQGKVERIIDCQTNCIFLRQHLVTHI